MANSVGGDFYNSQTVPSTHHNPFTGYIHNSQQFQYATLPYLAINVPVTGTYNNSVDICDGQIPVAQDYSYQVTGSNKRCRPKNPVTGTMTVGHIPITGTYLRVSKPKWL